MFSLSLSLSLSLLYSLLPPCTYSQEASLFSVEGLGEEGEEGQSRDYFSLFLFPLASTPFFLPPIRLWSARESNGWAVKWQ